MTRARWAEGRTPRIDTPAATALGWPDAHALPRVVLCLTLFPLNRRWR